MTDDELLRESERLVDARRNSDGMPEFSDKKDFEDFLHQLLSLGGNEVQTIYSSNSSLGMIVKYN